MNKKSGISLIVLVITIIVIIILAVAVILTLSNNNPIENAKFAVEKNDEATLKEEATLLYADWYLQKNSPNGISTELGDADDYVKDKLKGNYSDELRNSLFVSNTGEITIGKKESGPVIPTGFVASQATGEDKVETGLVIYEGTDAVTDANVTEARLTRNQFVWVPVEEGTFKREGFKDNISIYSEPHKTDDYTTEEEEYLAMVASVEKYGGFYIGRYEASKKTVNGLDIAQSIANVNPWNEITWGESMTEVGTTGVVAKARAVYPDSETKLEGEAVSTLPYGVQWDATVRFLEKKYSGISTDSTDYGNYYDSTFTYTALDGTTKTREINTTTLIPTGSTERNETNNIYDLAGNVWEWTMETCTGSSDRVVRGGDYCDSGSGYPVSDRGGGYFDIDDVNSSVGFRLALYIK